MSKPKNMTEEEAAAYKEKEAACIAARRKGIEIMEKVTQVKLATQHIRIDGGTQTRAELDESVVAEYSDAMQNNITFPPCVIYFDGSQNWLADGFHRWHAANGAGKSLLCEKRLGTRRDAILYSVGANGAHGLRRSNADKHKSVETLLNDAEWGNGSDRWIADKCGVSHTFVGSIRAIQVATVATSNNTRTGKDGKEYPAERAAGSRFGATQQPTENAALSTPSDISPDAFDDETPEPDEIEDEDLSGNPSGIYVETTTEIVNDDLPDAPLSKAKLSKAEEDLLPEPEWLETLPLLQKLRDENMPTRLFTEAALNYRHMAKIFRLLRADVKSVVSESSDDDFSKAVRSVSAISHPSEWKFSRERAGGFQLW